MSATAPLRGNNRAATRDTSNGESRKHGSRTTEHNDTKAILSARRIVNRFGRQKIHDSVELDVQPGEIVGIAGGSGSGKSVLLKTLAGLRRPNAGEVLVGGRRIESIGASERAALIGVLFQQGALFSSLSVAQNIMLPLREHTDLPPQAQEAIAGMKLALAGLSADVGVKSPSQLSGGMVKRAALARALALDPRILLLDEPTSDLDPVTAAGIDELIRKLNEALKVTVVVVTHDLNTIFSVCHRVALLFDGKLAIDTPEELRRSTEPKIREFLHGPRADAAMTARSH